MIRSGGRIAGDWQIVVIGSQSVLGHRDAPERLATSTRQRADANTVGVEGLCLEVHDLAIAKYTAGRPKDLAFTATLAQHGLTRGERLLARADRTRLEPAGRTLVLARIRRDFAGRQRRGV